MTRLTRLMEVTWLHSAWWASSSRLHTAGCHPRRMRMLHARQAVGVLKRGAVALGAAIRPLRPVTLKALAWWVDRRHTPPAVQAIQPYSTRGQRWPLASPVEEGLGVHVTVTGEEGIDHPLFQLIDLHQPVVNSQLPKREGAQDL